MSSEENFRRLGLSIIMLEEKLEELKTYAEEMERDKSKFDSDVLINISRRCYHRISILIPLIIYND